MSLLTEVDATVMTTQSLYAVQGNVNGKEVWPVLKASSFSADYVNGANITGTLTVTGPIGFFGTNPAGIQTVQSSDGVSGIMSALVAYGLIISAP
jgi:hypothetical protein